MWYIFETIGTDPAWTVTGVMDMKELPKNVSKDENNSTHVENIVVLAKS